MPSEKKITKKFTEWINLNEEQVADLYKAASDLANKLRKEVKPDEWIPLAIAHTCHSIAEKTWKNKQISIKQLALVQRHYLKVFLTDLYAPGLEYQLLRCSERSARSERARKGHQKKFAREAAEKLVADKKEADKKKA